MGCLGAWWKFILGTGDCHWPAWVWTVLAWWDGIGHTGSRELHQNTSGQQAWWAGQWLCKRKVPKCWWIILSSTLQKLGWHINAGEVELMHRVLEWRSVIQDCSRSYMLYVNTSTVVGDALQYGSLDLSPEVPLPWVSRVLQRWNICGQCVLRSSIRC